MTARLLDIDPLSGAVETFEWDEAEGRAIIKRVEDVEPIIEANKREQTSSDGYTASRDMRKAASIPMGVVLLWREQYGVDVFDQNHWPAVKRLLNSNEWAYLRSAEFTL